MPARTAEKVFRNVLHASGKVNGRPHKWQVGVFANEARLKAYAAVLKLTYASGDVAAIHALDIHSPAAGTEAAATDIKLSQTVTQYNPEPPALDEDTALS